VPGAGWRAAESAALGVRIDRPWLALGWDGSMARDRHAAWTARSAGSLSWYAPALGPLALAMSGALAREDAGSTAVRATRADAWSADASLSYRVGRGGAWISAGRERATPPALATRLLARPGSDSSNGSIAPTTPRYEYGVWRQIGGAVLSVSVDARALWGIGTTTRLSFATRFDTLRDSITGAPVGFRTRTDTSRIVASTAVQRRSSDAQARIVWARGRLALDIAAGQRLVGFERGTPWARGEATWALDRRMALVAGAGSATAPDAFAAYGALAGADAAGGHSYLSLGVRVSPRALFTRPRLPAAMRATASRFEVRREGEGTYRLVVTAPFARTVELTGDFTAWTPVALVRRGDDRWETTLAMKPGAHHVNIRVDGERWIAPPGTTVAADDFAGTVGVLVVQ
jgi:hypothetical protein